jgi:hypothetical protein
MPNAMVITIAMVASIVAIAPKMMGIVCESKFAVAVDVSIGLGLGAEKVRLATAPIPSHDVPLPNILTCRDRER